MKRISLAIALLALAACKTAGPDYHAPQASTPDRFGERAPGLNTESVDLSTWWAQLGDPVLNDLIARARAQSLDLASAASHIREARDQITIAQAALLPSVSGSAIAARRDATAGRSSGGSSGSSGSDLAPARAVRRPAP